jgi:hypothetical protein
MTDPFDVAMAQLDRAVMADVLRQLAGEIEGLPTEHGSAPFHSLRPYLLALRDAIRAASTIYG